MSKSGHFTLFAALLLLCSQAFGQLETRVELDLPGGEVADSLAALSKQMDLQLIYRSDSLVGLRSDPVRGKFSPSEALDLLLRKTAFVAVQDGETGAFAIVRRETDDVSTRANTTTPNPNSQLLDNSDMNSNDTNKDPFAKRVAGGILSLVLVGSSPVVAQDEEVFELTPFEVSAQDNQGYRATSTLAGTRMRMSLDDVGSSVSVFTEELMNDLAATDNETLLAYGLGTEVGGARGNFINPNTEGLENENLIDPQSNNRIRGLTSADTTRNYFKSDVPWDSYNTNRIDVQRGPNSILFGLGSPAGIINNTTSVAGFSDENRVTLRYDQFGSFRAAGTFNRVVIEDQLAVRLDLLSDNREFRQNPAFEDDNRISASLTYQPEAWNTDETKARFTVNYENGSIDANRQRMVVPLDSVSSYFIPAGENGFQGADFANGGVFGPSSDISGPAGRTFNPVTDEEVLDSVSWLRGTTNGNPWPIFAFDAQNPGAGFSVYEEAVNAEGSFFQAQGSRDTAGQTAIVVNDGAFVNPVAASNRPQDVYVRGVQQNIFGYTRLTTVGKQRLANDSGFGFSGFWRDPSFASTSQFDFMNHLIDGNNKLESQDFDLYEINFRNTFFNDRLGYQISYFRQDYEARQDANLGAIFAPEIQVEANTIDPLSDNLASPLANPTAGRAFVDFELRLRGGREEIRNRNALQAQVFATLDSQDFMDDGFLSRLVGKHDFTALFKNRELERYRREFNSMGVDEASIRSFGLSGPDDPDLNPRYDPANADPGPGARMVRLANAFGSVQPRIRVYLDAPGPNLTNIQPFADPIVPSGSYGVRGFVAAPNSGFTAVEAAEPWIAPDGDEEVQANNPANYAGTSANKGNINIVTATDSQDALEYLTARRFFDDEDIDTQAFVWSGGFLDRTIVGMYGWREDKAKQGGLEHDFARIADENSEGRTGGPVFDPNSSFIRETSGDFQSRNWSVKLDATKALFDATGMDDNDFPLRISLLYSEGEVQNPQPGRRDVLLNDLTPSTGSTIDRSIVFSSKDGKYSLRATKYDTVQQNANAGSVAASENWRIEQVLREGIRNGVVQIEQRTGGWANNPVLDNGDDVDDPGEISASRSQEIRDAGFNDVLAWGDSIASAFRSFQNELFSTWPASQSWITGGEPGTDFINVNFPDDTVFIEDNTSFGYEYEFFAQPTENWNVIINSSQTQVLRSRVFGDEVNEVLDFIVGELSGPAGQVPLWGPEGQMGQARVAPFLGQLITNRALLGTPTGELREWKHNLITNYDFTEGVLGGFGIGGAVRFEDSQVIGFPPQYVDPVTGEVLPDGSRPDKALSVDLSNPFTDSSRETFDLWFKYRTKLTDRVDMRLQLNIYNVGDDKGTVPLFINPDGTVGTRGIRMGRSWALTSTFIF